MKLINHLKKIIIVSLIIAAIPTPAKAAWYDTLFSYAKENAPTILTAIAGIACCGLLLWKKNNEIENLKSKHRTDEHLAAHNAENAALERCQSTHTDLINQHKKPLETEIAQLKSKNEQLNTENESATKARDNYRLRLQNIGAGARKYDSSFFASRLSKFILNVSGFCKVMESLKSNNNPVSDRSDFQPDTKQSAEQLTVYKEKLVYFTDCLQTLESLKKEAATMSEQQLEAQYNAILKTKEYGSREMYEAIHLDKAACSLLSYNKILAHISRKQNSFNTDLLINIKPVFKNEFTKLKYDAFINGNDAIAQFKACFGLQNKTATLQSTIDKNKTYLDAQLKKLEEAQKQTKSKTESTQSGPKIDLSAASPELAAFIAANPPSNGFTSTARPMAAPSSPIQGTAAQATKNNNPLSSVNRSGLTQPRTSAQATSNPSSIAITIDPVQAITPASSLSTISNSPATAATASPTTPQSPTQNNGWFSLSSWKSTFGFGSQTTNKSTEEGFNKPLKPADGNNSYGDDDNVV